jgi:hypothetical protein
MKAEEWQALADRLESLAHKIRYRESKRHCKQHGHDWVSWMNAPDSCVRCGMAKVHIEGPCEFRFVPSGIVLRFSEQK